MVRGVNIVPNQTMKRIEIHNSLILRKAFYNRKAFLTFVYSPNSISMDSYLFLRSGGLPFAVIIFYFLLPQSYLPQERNTLSNYEKYLHLAQVDTLSLEARKRFLRISFKSIKFSADDSLKYSRISKLVEVSSPLKDSVLFHRLASEGHKLATSLKNPSLLGDTHWNYGSYYLNKKEYDSSYFHYNSAYTAFAQARNDYYAGKMLYNMAYIASQTNDFTGAEILLFRSIKIFESTKKTQQQYRCYNLLGANADDMEEYGKALAYYKKAARLIPFLENSKYYQLENWNNLGVHFSKLGDFTQALPYFKKALPYQAILATNPMLHAKLLDNQAYCLLALGKTENVYSSMKKAMVLRDSIEDTEGLVISKLRFANYYGKVGDTLNAVVFAKDALQLAEKNYLTRDVLDALEKLSVLDKPNTLSYLQQHIALDKSLNARDRNLRNKFTAIQYETDKYIRENERLFRQRLWIVSGAIGVTLILLLIYLNTMQRAKNKELLFESEQQQYNEDLFLLALDNKTTPEIGRNQERLRISEELHDGILARLFSIRFKWGFLPLEGTSENLREHKQSLDALTDIETQIRNISHDLRNELIWNGLEFINEIENNLREKGEVGNFKYSFKYNGLQQWEAADYFLKINISRMLEEILQNIIKHAFATVVDVTFIVAEDQFVITVVDNGKGFRPWAVKKGIGLKNLTNRTQKLNGQITIQSQIGIGTTIVLSIPNKIINNGNY